MKKTHRILGLIAALLLVQLNANQLRADNIDLQTARQLAAQFMAGKTGQKSITASDVKLVYEIPNDQLGIPAVYFFNTHNGGFLVMSANDCMIPIIAYSTESVLDPNHMAPAMLWYMNQYARAISHYQNTQAQPDAETLMEWKRISNGQVALDNSKQVYRTLTSQWDQDYPYNIYSPMCSDNEGNQVQAPTGCVATAMAQIIHYWEYPVCPTSNVYHVNQGTTWNINFDTVRYNYDLMPDTAKRKSGPSWNPTYTMWWNEDQISETAKLNLHCGLTVKMSYDWDGSGTQSTKVPNALRKNFKYEKDSLVEMDRTKYPYYHSSAGVTVKDTNWVLAIAQDIKAGRPVYYSGHDNTSSGVHAAGHAFVAERYNSSNMKIWFNWGWGPWGGDCWCDVLQSQLSVGGYNFSAGHYAIRGIQPPQDTLDARNGLLGIYPMEEPVQMLPVYPNPTSEWVNIPYSLGGADQALLQIFSLDGRLMEQRTVYSSSAQACVNVANFPKGLYVCRIGEVTRKFVVE